MNTKTSKIVAKLFAVLLVLTVLSSCHRGGTGCPNQFKAFPVSILPFSK